MCNEFKRELYKSEVLEKYANAPEKYTIHDDTLITAGKLWMIKYCRNPSDDSVISVLNGDVVESERTHWKKYRIYE